jgi:hypothetical protein
VDLVTFTDMRDHFFRVVLDKIVFVPNGLRFDIGLLCINCLFVLSFYSFFSLFIVDFYVIFYPFHDNLLIEVLFCFYLGFVWIMLQLDSLPDAIELESFLSLF